MCNIMVSQFLKLLTKIGALDCQPVYSKCLKPPVRT
jgi:hypothetical protein